MVFKHPQVFRNPEKFVFLFHIKKKKTVGKAFVIEYFFIDIVRNTSNSILCILPNGHFFQNVSLVFERSFVISFVKAHLGRIFG